MRKSDTIERIVSPSPPSRNRSHSNSPSPSPRWRDHSKSPSRGKPRYSMSTSSSNLKERNSNNTEPKKEKDFMKLINDKYDYSKKKKNVNTDMNSTGTATTSNETLLSSDYSVESLTKKLNSKSTSIFQMNKTSDNLIDADQMSLLEEGILCFQFAIENAGKVEPTIHNKKKLFKLRPPSPRGKSKSPRNSNSNNSNNQNKNKNKTTGKVSPPPPLKMDVKATTGQDINIETKSPRRISNKLRKGKITKKDGYISSSIDNLKSVHEILAQVKSPADDIYSSPNDPVIVGLQGPILYTAPHGLEVFRGGQILNERRRLHRREKWSTELALKLAIYTREAGIDSSFIVWNMKTAKKADENYLDPNYLIPEQFGESAWHQGLLKFRHDLGRGGVLPILHVDIHGKKDRKTNLDLDLGIKPLICEWESETEAIALQQCLIRQFEECFKDCCPVRGDMSFGVESDPYLDGYWGDDCHTISHQSIRLKIPSVQLEIPYTMRRKLYTDDEFCRRFAKAISLCYSTVVSFFNVFENHELPHYPNANENLVGYLPIRDGNHHTRVCEAILQDIALLDSLDTKKQI